MIDAFHESTLLLGSDLVVKAANRRFYEQFSLSPEVTVGRSIASVGGGEWDSATLLNLLAAENKPAPRSASTPLQATLTVGGKSVRAYLRWMYHAESGSRDALLTLGDDVSGGDGDEPGISESRYQTLFHMCPLAIYSCDSEGLILQFNRTAAELWGREPALSNPQDRYCGSLKMFRADGSKMPHDQCPAQAVLSGRVPSVVDIEVFIERPDGSKILVIINVQPLRNARGDLIGALNCFYDVTKSRQMKTAINESEIRYRRLFQTAKDGILILDAQSGKIIDANAFMAGLLGQELPQLLGKELWEIGMFSDIAQNKAMFRELQEKSYVRYDHLPVQARNGETTQVEFVSNVYQEGDRMVAQCNVRDISARVVMEKQIGVQAAALADQARQKDEFLAMLSHELRNPLAPIRSATHLLRLQEKGSENPIQKQAREVIERQVANLTRLVGDLMEVSRALTGRIRLEIETIDLNLVLKHAIETVTPLVEQRNHNLSLKAGIGPLWIKGDSARMEEVFVNLLGNAAKYTEIGGRIEVLCERHQNHALVRVRDSGAGIDSALLPRIFDLFAQAERTLDRSQGGLGIGLSLAHRVVELHGGTLEAASDGPGKGSEFVVRMQLAPAPDGVLPLAASQPASKAGGLRILVVDDNVDACLMLANLIRHQGHSVEIAHSGPSALAAAFAWSPDIVLLDIGLPGIDGYEVARRLRADSRTKNARLVAVTGYGAEKDVQLGREAGFDAHFLKPVELTEIEKMLLVWQRPPNPA